MYTVYVLRSLKNGRLYTGYTNNLLRRLKEHCVRRTEYTRATRPYILVYQERYADRQKAINRERFLKTGKGRDMLKSKHIK